MAEDLRIRVKVDPNLDGLQEQRDGKAKNLHLDIKLFDDADIEKQVSAIYKKIQSASTKYSNQLVGAVQSSMGAMKLYSASMADMNAMMKTGEISNKNLAKAMAEVNKERKNTALIQKDSAATQAKRAINNDPEIKSLREKREALKRELSSIKQESSEFKKQFNDIFSNIAVISSGDDLSIDKQITQFTTDLKSAFKKSVGDIGEELSDLTDGNDLSKLYEQIDGIFTEIKDGVEHNSSFSDVQKNIKEIISRSSDEWFGYDDETKASVEHWWDNILSVFISKSGEFTETEEAVKAKGISFINSFQKIYGSFNDSVLDAIDASESGDKSAVTKSMENVFGSLDSLSGLFHETSARTKEEISKDIDAIEESIAARRIDVIKELFGEQNTAALKELGVQIGEELADGVDKGIASSKANEKVIPNTVGEDDNLKSAADTLIAMQQKMIELQTQLTIEKKATVEAENAIGDAAQANVDKLKDLVASQKSMSEQIRANVEATSANLQLDSGSISDATGKAKGDVDKATQNLAMLTTKLKNLDTSGLKDVFSSVKKFVADMSSADVKYDAVTEKINDLKKAFIICESTIDAYKTAITELNTYFAQNALVLKAMTEATGGKTTDAASGKAKKTNTQTEEQVAAKVTTLLNKAEKAGQAVVDAVQIATDSFTQITKGLNDAAVGAKDMKKATQPIISAVTSLNNVFDTYKNALDNANLLVEQTKKAPTEEKIDVGPLTQQIEAVGQQFKDAGDKVANVTAALETAATTAGTLDASVKILIDAGKKLGTVFTTYEKVATSANESITAIGELDSRKATAAINKIKKYLDNVAELYAATPDKADKIEAAKKAKEEAAKADTNKTTGSGIAEATQKFKDVTESSLGQIVTALSDVDVVLQKLDAMKATANGSSKAKDKIIAALNDLIDVFNKLSESGKTIKGSVASLTKLKDLSDELNMEDFAKVINNAVKKQMETITGTAKKAAKKAAANTDEGSDSKAAAKTPTAKPKKTDAERALDNAKKKAEAAEKSFDGILRDIARVDTFGVENNKNVRAAKGAIAQTTEDYNQLVSDFDAAPTVEGSQKIQAAVDALRNSYKDLKAAVTPARKAIEDAAKATTRYESLTAQFDNLNFLDGDISKFADEFKEIGQYKDAVAQAIAELRDTGGAEAVQKTTDALDNLEYRIDSIAKKSTGVGARKFVDMTDVQRLSDTGFDVSGVEYLNDEYKAQIDLVDNLQQKYKDDPSKENLSALQKAVADLNSKYIELISNIQNAGLAVEKLYGTADTHKSNNFAINSELSSDDLTKMDAYIKRITSKGNSKGALDSEKVKPYLDLLNNVRQAMADALSTPEGAQNVYKIFDMLAESANEAKIKITSLDDVLEVCSIVANKAADSAKAFNDKLKSDRDIQSWSKSMNNTFYTAQRYLENNTKIMSDSGKYAEFMDFLNKYQGLIQNKQFTQENANKMSSDWSNLKRSIQEAGLETDKFSDKLQKLFGVNIASQFANDIINRVQAGLRQVYQNVVDIDSAMTELKKVTDETASTYDQFLSDAGNRAKEVGSTVSNIISATADYARLGYNLDDAKTLADVSAVYYNVGDDLDSFSTATDNIVGTMKAFNLEADDAIGLVDKLNEVSNNYAVTSGDLGDILQRSASAMEAAGNTLDQTIALGTAMNSVLQSADTTGTTLKVLALRLRGASTELASMGEETDGVATSTSKLRAQIAALTNVDGTGGFDILTKSGDFKSTYDIIQGIAKVYTQMSDVDQAALLELIAGKNRANGVAALLNQAAQAEDVLNTSMNSSGSALKENERVLESIEGKLKKFQASFQSLSSDLLDSNLVKGIIDIGSAALDMADGFVKAGDAIPTLITAFSGIATLMGTKAGVIMPFYAVGIAA